MTRLIDGDALEKAIYEWMPKDQEKWMDSDIPPIENLVVSIMMTIQEQPTVDTVPIEWINQRVKSLKIQLINADEDDVDLIWHLRDEIQTLTELIDYWKAEQEKADNKKSYFPKGFFSKERPIAKGEEDETD